MTSLLIPQDPPKETAADRRYAKRIPRRGLQHSQNLTLDLVTTEVLKMAQHLEEMKTNGKILSRTVIIRRAVLTYATMLTKIAQDKNVRVLEKERKAMLEMSAKSKPKKLLKVPVEML